MSEDVGRLVLRLTVGGLLLFHGIHKLLSGLGDVRHLLAAHGAPELLAYGAYVGEIAAPLLILFGLFARLGGGLVVVNMIVAVALAGGTRLLVLNGQGGYALELEAFFLFGGLAIALLGAGRLSIGGADGQLN
ncbi:MAG: DoxX family protein [Rhizomicrobium sp.]|jgi:putative oxidoreductase